MFILGRASRDETGRDFDYLHVMSLQSMKRDREGKYYVSDYFSTSFRKRGHLHRFLRCLRIPPMQLHLTLTEQSLIVKHPLCNTKLDSSDSAVVGQTCPCLHVSR